MNLYNMAIAAVSPSPTQSPSLPECEQGVNHVVNRLRETRVGSEFLTQPDQHERLDEAIPLHGTHDALHDIA